MIPQILIILAVLGCLMPPQLSLAAPSEHVAELERRAKSGDAEAQFQLGRAYFRGDGVPKDETNAFRWIEKSATQGNSDAVATMGFFYSQGIGAEKSEALAMEWFRRGADAGSATSKLNLGLLLRQGKSVQLSNKESLRLMREAADSGLPEAQSYLGQLYFMGDRLQPPDHAKAKDYALQAAKAGDAASQNITGILMRDGIGPAAEGKDPEAAETWFRKAAERNEVKAQSNLAHLMGVASPASTNRVEALKWLLLAKDRNEPTASKTYDEIAATLPPDLEKEARGQAARFLLEHGSGPSR